MHQSLAQWAAIYSDRPTRVYRVDVDGLTEGDVLSDAYLPSESIEEGFQIIVDVAIRSYPTLRVKLFGGREHIGVACKADYSKSCGVSCVKWLPGAV